MHVERNLMLRRRRPARSALRLAGALSHLGFKYHAIIRRRSLRMKWRRLVGSWLSKSSAIALVYRLLRGDNCGLVAV